MWTRVCKSCGKILTHVNEQSYKKAIRRNKPCNGCARRGVKRTEEQRNRIRVATKIAMNMPEMRDKIKRSLNNPEVKSKMIQNGYDCADKLKLDPIKYENRISNLQMSRKMYWDNISVEENEEIQRKKSKSIKKTFERIGFSQQMSKRMAGVNNPFYGRKHTEETIERLRKISVDRLKSREVLYACDTKPELEFVQLLVDNNIKYEKQFVLNNKVYDFYLLEYNTLVEIDGAYWHSKGVPVEKMNVHQFRRWKNDRYKDKLAKNNNIRLIRIWDVDIKTFDIIKEIINYE